MDWNTVRTEATRREPEPATLLETCWRVKNPSGTTVYTCGIFRDAAPGLDVRLWGKIEDDLIRSQRSAEIGSARELAAQWKQVLDKGFVDVLT